MNSDGPENMFVLFLFAFLKAEGNYKVVVKALGNTGEGVFI